MVEAGQNGDYEPAIVDEKFCAWRWTRSFPTPIRIPALSQILHSRHRDLCVPIGFRKSRTRIPLPIFFLGAHEVARYSNITRARRLTLRGS